MRPETPEKPQNPPSADPEPDERPDFHIVEPPPDEARSILESAEIVGGSQVQLGSNYTFLVHLDAGDGDAGGGAGDAGGDGGDGGDGRVMRAIYKPRDGERPLSDYPDGTLYRREYAAFLVSSALGWPSIPMTVIRDGPYGLGSMQRFVEFDPAVTYFDLRDHRIDELAPFAAFDLLVNNGDRKGGHFLQDPDGVLWSVDHGLTFHHHFKLRTVMLEFWGKPIPEALMAALGALVPELEDGGTLRAALDGQLSRTEVDALRARLDSMLESRAHPMLDPNRNVPWPLV